MKKNIFLTLVLIMACFTISATKAYAKILINQTGNVNLAKTEVVDDDLFIGAQNTTIDGIVNGDVFVGGQTVTVNGTINGNLHIGAGMITISKGWIKGNVYAASGNVIINGSIIDGSLLVGAGNVSIDQDTTIAGSVIAGAGSALIDSQVKRSVYLGTGNGTIGSNAKIGRDLYYAISQKEQNINIAKGSVISGKIYKTDYQMPASTVKAPKNTGIISSILFFLGALIVGFLYFKFCEIHFTESACIVSKNFWKSLGIGFLIIIGIIPALIIAMITVVGIPLAGVTLLIFLLGLYFAKLVVGFALGHWIAEKLEWNKLSPYWVFALGLAVVYILKNIPIFGGLISIIVMWVGLGALVLRFKFSLKS